MISKAKIILTSDDFGLSTVYNNKILEMLKQDLLTSVSVMVKRVSDDQLPQFEELIILKRNKQISIGLHLELSDCNYTNEMLLQFSLFEYYLGFKPDYMDLHKGGYFKGNLNIIADFCHFKHLAFRKYPLTTSIVACPNLSITATNMDYSTLENVIFSFENDKIYEIVFHIGVFDPISQSTLNRERERDLEKLIKVHQLIKQRKLILTNYKECV